MPTTAWLLASGPLVDQRKISAFYSLNPFQIYIAKVVTYAAGPADKNIPFTHVVNRPYPCRHEGSALAHIRDLTLFKTRKAALGGRPIGVSASERKHLWPRSSDPLTGSGDN